MIRFRKELGLGQPAAALDADIPVDSLRRYENGTRGVDALVLGRLAEAYGRSVNDFYMDDPPPGRPENRPAFFVRLREGVEMDQALYEELVAFVEDIHRRHRETRVRKPKKK